MLIDPGSDLVARGLVRSADRNAAEKSRDRENQCGCPDPKYVAQDEDEQDTSSASRHLPEHSNLPAPFGGIGQELDLGFKLRDVIVRIGRSGSGAREH
jgi:hypothetical protein